MANAARKVTAKAAPGADTGHSVRTLAEAVLTVARNDLTRPPGPMMRQM